MAAAEKMALAEAAEATASFASFYAVSAQDSAEEVREGGDAEHVAATTALAEVAQERKGAADAEVAAAEAAAVAAQKALDKAEVARKEADKAAAETAQAATHAEEAAAAAEVAAETAARQSEEDEATAVRARAMADEAAEGPQFIMACRIQRFISFAAGVTTGRIARCSATRAFALDATTAAKRRSKKRRSIKNLKRDGRGSMNEGDALLEGSLEKLASGRRKRWQLRYFSLRGHYLKYYADNRKAEVKGVIDMACVDNVDVEGNMITLDLGGSPLQLRADGAEEGEDGGKAMSPEQEASKWGAIFEVFAAQNNPAGGARRAVGGPVVI